MKVVIIGGVATGPKAAARLRRLNPEYKQERIEDPRIKLIPLGMLRQRMNELSKDKEIIAFCKFSLRGYEAQTILNGEGYENVKFMDGGIEAWPYGLVSDASPHPRP